MCRIFECLFGKTFKKKKTEEQKEKLLNDIIDENL